MRGFSFHVEIAEEQMRFSAPIVVFQVGKVGSITIQKALQDLQLGVPIYHCHCLANFEWVLERARTHLPNFSEAPLKGGAKTSLETWKEIRDKFDASDKRWHFISAVREPVTRNVSAFFQGIQERIPDFAVRVAQGITIQEVEQVFLDDVIANQAPHIWFEKQFEPVVGVDVYQGPYPFKEGFQIFETERARALLLRLEDFEWALENAMNSFLGIPDFKISDKRNTSEEKAYGDFIKRFLREIRLPDWYLKSQYESQYARHFYTDEEREELMAKWRR